MKPKISWTFHKEHCGNSCAKTCESCGKRLAKNKPMFVREERCGWFRGDDEVLFFCSSCGTRKKQEEREQGLWP